MAIEEGASQREFTKLTVNLINKAVEALDSAAAVTQLSKTDTVNRALQVYAFMIEEQEKGGQLLVRELDGTLSRIRMI
jgi:hypothetical protein